MQAPTPRLGQGRYVQGYGEPGGPMMEQGGGPRVPDGGLSLPPTGGSRETGMTGPAMPPTGNAPMNIQPLGSDSAADTQRDVLGAVVELVERNGGRPFDPR